MGLDNREYKSQTPHNGDDGNDGKPGYPPPGHKQRLAKIATKEAAQQGNPDAILNELENKETADARKVRLKKFVSENFKNECPPEQLEEAVGVCESYEDENRELFEDPKFMVTVEDVGDLKPEIDEIVKKGEKLEIVASNDKKIAAATKKKKAAEKVIPKNDQKITSRKTEVKTETVKTPKLETKAVQAEAKEANAKTDQEFIEKNYDKLLASKGQAGAIRELMQNIKSPQVKARLKNILGTIDRLQNIIPGKSGALNKLLNSSKLNLSSGSAIGAFAPFIAKVDASHEFTDEEKKSIHTALHHHPNNPRAAKSAIAQGRGTETDPETGETKTLPYDKDHKLALEGGGYLHSENGSLVVSTGDWSHTVPNGTLPSDLKRWVSFGKDQHDLQSIGVEDFMGFKFGLHQPESHLRQFEKVKNALLGGGRGLEGSFASHGDNERFKHIVKFISSNGESPFRVDEGVSAKSMKGLGIAPNGILEVDTVVLKEVGNFFQETPTAHGEEAYGALRKRLGCEPNSIC